MSSTVTSRPAGRPSTMTTRARPWDSPAVRYRSTPRRYLPPPPRLDSDHGERHERAGDGDRGPEGERPVAAPLHQQDDAGHRADQPGQEPGVEHGLDRAQARM